MPGGKGGAYSDSGWVQGEGEQRGAIRQLVQHVQEQIGGCRGSVGEIEGWASRHCTHSCNQLQATEDAGMRRPQQPASNSHIRPLQAAQYTHATPTPPGLSQCQCLRLLKCRYPLKSHKKSRRPPTSHVCQVSVGVDLQVCSHTQPQVLVPPMLPILEDQACGKTQTKTPGLAGQTQL